MPKTSEFSRRQFAASALATAALTALPAASRADAKMQQIKGDENMNLTPYLLFDGNCHQAMEFYKSCFGGELTSMKVKDSPAKDYMPAVQREKTINARLKSGNVELSASDWLRARGSLPAAAVRRRRPVRATGQRRLSAAAAQQG